MAQHQHDARWTAGQAGAVRSIAATVASAAEAEWLIPAAVDAAAGFGAHLTVVRPVETIVPYAGDIAYDPGLLQHLMSVETAETDAIRAVFDRVTAAEDARAEFRCPGDGRPVADWAVLDALRAADLIVIGRLPKDDAVRDRMRLQEAVIRGAGRPVLLLPPDAAVSGPFGHIVIGWSPTKEATRAAHDALALAAPGARLDILSVGHGGQGPDSRGDLAAALDRRGFRVELVDREGGAGRAGEVLLQAAAERGAEAIATGAFGHSKFYDFVIGAVTSHLLAESACPVILSR